MIYYALLIPQENTLKYCELSYIRRKYQVAYELSGISYFFLLYYKRKLPTLVDSIGTNTCACPLCKMAFFVLREISSDDCWPIELPSKAEIVIEVQRIFISSRIGRGIHEVSTKTLQNRSYWWQRVNAHGRCVMALRRWRVKIDITLIMKMSLLICPHWRISQCKKRQVLGVCFDLPIF